MHFSSSSVRTTYERYSSTSSDGAEDDVRWSKTCESFLAAVPESLREQIGRSYNGLHAGGAGIRAWISSIVWRGGKLPSEIPAELLEIYLTDPEATPIHDCEDCGVAIPVRPNRLWGEDGDPEQTYFPTCPICGGRTGRYRHISHQIQFPEMSDELRRSKPR